MAVKKKIKIGTAGIPFGCRTTNESPEYLSSAGLGALEIEFVRSIYLNKTSAKKFSLIAKKYNISISTHAPYFINLNSLSKETIKKSKNILIRALEISDCLNAKVCVVHAGYYSGKDKKETFNIIKAGIKEIIKKANCKTLLGIEVMGKQSQFGGLKETLELCKNVANTTPVIDFAHIHARGNGCIKTKQDFIDILNLCKKYNFTKLHCHFSGILYKNGNEKKHLPIDSKEPDYVILAKILKQRNDFDLTFICESPNSLKDALLFKSYLNDE
jgi:deoxyribonuclease-4